MSSPVEPVAPEPNVVDAAVDAYSCWREECAGAREAYNRWSSAGKADRMDASSAYIAALDREETAAGVYADAMRRFGDEWLDALRAEPRRTWRGYAS